MQLVVNDWSNVTSALLHGCLKAICDKAAGTGPAGQAKTRPLFFSAGLGNGCLFY